MLSKRRTVMADLKIYSALERVFIHAGPHDEQDGYIRIRGVNLTGVTHVSVDGVIKRDFELIAESIISVQGSALSEVIAYTSIPSAEEATIILGVTDRAVFTSSGAEVLKQRVIKALVSDEASDAFSGLGSGLDALAGSAVGDRAITDAVSKIRDVERALLASERPDEPLDSSLSQINILGALQESERQSRILIQIINRAGESVETEVVQ